jgi:hypothetical protein
VRGGVGVDFGKMKGKRVEQKRRDSMRPGAVERGMGRAVVIVSDVVGSIAADAGEKSDRWREKNAGGE